ncbi:MAG: glycosyltransferase [Deinococcales bacterium]|nr:glycosyltransferase [Chitinophagaceae bacterium]
MFEATLAFVWHVLQLLIGYNLVLPILLLGIYIFRKRQQPLPTITTSEADYAIIVTAYQHTGLLPIVVNSLLKLNYNNYLIYVVADNCDISHLHFDSDKVVLLRPKEVLASNTKSHFYAINRFKRQHERLTIIDSDNLVDANYLLALNKYFNLGFEAVQGERKAKNLNTTYACLDAARDVYYHFYDGQVLFGIGSSATLAGSGMAFTVALYKTCLQHLNITGAGFDKVLQNEIVTRKYRIAFTKDAIVYDEKTTASDQLVKQRARWINTWFKYFKFGFGLLAKGIGNANWNQFLFGLVLLRPPLFIFLILSLFCLGVNVFINPLVALYWLLGFLMFIVGFILSLLVSKTDSRIYQSLWNIPKFVFFQVLSLLKVRKANEVSVSTQHSYQKSIEEINN